LKNSLPQNRLLLLIFVVLSLSATSCGHQEPQDLAPVFPAPTPAASAAGEAAAPEGQPYTMAKRR